MLNRSQGGREGRDSFDSWGNVQVENLAIGKAGVPAAVCEMSKGLEVREGAREAHSAVRLWVRF